MTRREWEEELSKYLCALPSSERERVLEYYDELYEDKREMGVKPVNIINEFGNPKDVAEKIIEEYKVTSAEFKYEPEIDIDSLRQATAAHERVREEALQEKAEAVRRESSGRKYTESKKPSISEINNYGDPRYYSKNEVKLFDIILSIIYIAFCVAIGFAGVIYVITCLGVMAGSVTAGVYLFINGVTGAKLFVNLGICLAGAAVGMFLLSLSGLLFRLSKWCAKKVSKHINKQKTKVRNRGYRI